MQVGQGSHRYISVVLMYFMYIAYYIVVCIIRHLHLCIFDTGMAVTLFQSRVLADPKHSPIHTTNNNNNNNNNNNIDIADTGESEGGVDEGRLLRDASVMREFGTRILVAEKNIGICIHIISYYTFVCVIAIVYVYRSQGVFHQPPAGPIPACTVPPS